MPDLHEDGPAEPGGYMLSDEVLDTLPRFTRTPPATDGYLDDAEQWGTEQELVDYARSSGHGVVPTREVLALLRLDRILGNEHALNERGTGRVRGVVSRALRDWHARQRGIAEQLGPSDPAGGPFPSGHPTSIAHGDLFTPSPAHPVTLRVFAPGLVEYDGRELRVTYEPAVPAPEGLVERLEWERDTARALLARRSSEWEQRSTDGRQQVASLVRDNQILRETNTHLVADRDDARRQLVEQGEAAEEQADALRSEVARLSGLLDEASGALASMHGKRDRARDHAVRNDAERDDLRDRLVEFVRNLAAEDWRPHAHDPAWIMQRPARIASSIEDLVLGERVGPADDLRSSDPDGDGPPYLVEEVAVPELLGRAEVSPHPIDDDPRRPHLDHYPGDALLLTYRELRQLLALHVEAVGESILSADDQARAMRDGETPLRLPEVLDR